jgi:hypothetical protein
MTHFIKFSNLIINTIKINKIEILHNKYHIHLVNDKIDGFFLFSNGYIDARNDQYEICKDKNPVDYMILTEWIDKIN